MSVRGKQIILAVSGGIAAYKAATICSQLKQKGAEIKVIMTESATKFVQPLTFQSLSRQHVYVDTFMEADPSVVSHIDLADHADLVLVAPATANLIGKLANGIADDLLSTVLLATEAPVWLAPAMNGHMFAHPAVQQNIQTLVSRGVRFIQPGEGQLACGYVGKGRLAEPEAIINDVEEFFTQHETSWAAWWKDKRVLVTAGPTREEIDPVRYLSNHSSGKMGFSLAAEASSLGAHVTLVSGPVSLEPPSQVELVRVTSAAEMYREVLERFEKVDVVFKAAAVADYEPVVRAGQKLKKTDETLTLQLRKTKDILQALGQRKRNQLLIGFAAETVRTEEYAQQKLKKKNLDFVVANDVTQEGAGFGTDTNIVTLFARNGQRFEFPLMSKREVAKQLLKTVAETDV